ncbi:MotA/TolQ/ExbB proton channel family protein [Thioalkalivibrio sp. XN8]|uniref:MotA/TolQ/ExbB proton channel family protein n=1 Tax=Thioalkalivibrio sp. XN8 TaxID=2712863 RepID=UPI0013EDCAB3|nr:MotA/TolQ/ExbB proton channel family protein [Thioalkalivibrio sp. XN8]NGP54208.1 MotA/TolQ/ExbB proton channel family protein [Thioalkalivibrio sp. XN8]
MQMLFDGYVAIRDFLELGGDVLVLIVFVIFAMWVLIVERFMFFSRRRREMERAVRERWAARPERESWNAHQIRDALVSRFKLEATAGIPMIKTLVALCPLLGLLGTVTGMIAVFEVMAVSGTGNARSMAAGVAMATVPTMAGMVGALSGVFAGTTLARKADRSVEKLRDSLTMDI